MKKIISVIAKCLLYVALGIFGTLVSIAFLIGIAEGDLSHGLFHYL